MARVLYREITVLYRAHYITRIVEEVFLREKYLTLFYSGVQFFNRMEIGRFGIFTVDCI